MLPNSRVAILILASLIIFALGFLLTSSYELGFCLSDKINNVFDVSCHQFYERLGDPLFYGGGALAIVFVLLYAFPKAYDAWRKFAVWFVPLAALLFIFYPNPGSGDLLAPMPEQIFQWVSGLFIVISGVIVALKK